MQRAVTLRALDARDLEAVHALAAAVGWPHRAQDVAMMLSLGQGVAACGPDGAILGSAMRWDWPADCGTVGMVLVAPAAQGKGIGRQLMQGLLAAVPARAWRLHATLAGLGLYERLGFRPMGIVRQHQGIIGEQSPSRSAKADHPRLGPCVDRESHGFSAFAEDDGGGSLRSVQPADLSALIALDHAAFGAPRAALIARLTADGEIRVLERGGKLRGFVARRSFGRGETIGPLVAETEDDAIALAGAVLRPGFQRIDIPAEATALAAWLTRAGLAAVDAVTVMIRGEWPAVGGTARRFALASQALG
jgi:predicted N-acetyltransferase YhbS